MTNSEKNDLLNALVLRHLRSDKRLSAAAAAMERELPTRVRRLEPTAQAHMSLERVFAAFEQTRRDQNQRRAVLRVGKANGDSHVERVFQHLAHLLSDYNAVRRKRNDGEIDGGDDADDDDDVNDNVNDNSNSVSSSDSITPLRRGTRRPSSVKQTPAPKRTHRRDESNASTSNAPVATLDIDDQFDDNDDVALLGSGASSSTTMLLPPPPAVRTTNKRKVAPKRKNLADCEFIDVLAPLPAFPLDPAVLSLLNSDETAESLAQHINQIVAASSLTQFYAGGAPPASSSSTTAGPASPPSTTADSFVADVFDVDVDAIVTSFLETDPVGSRLLSPVRPRPAAVSDALAMPPPPTTPLRKRRIIRPLQSSPPASQPSIAMNSNSSVASTAPAVTAAPTPVDIDSFLVQLHTAASDDHANLSTTSHPVVVEPTPQRPVDSQPPRPPPPPPPPPQTETPDVESFLSDLHGTSQVNA